MKHNGLFFSWAALPFFCILSSYLRARFYLFNSLALFSHFLLSWRRGMPWGYKGNGQITARHFSRGVFKPMQVWKLASMICHGPCSNSDESLPWKCLLSFHTLRPAEPHSWVRDGSRHFSSCTATLRQWTKCFNRSHYFYFIFLEVP